MESAVYTGNICFCYPDYYTLSNQIYLGLGGGLEVRLNKYFSMDIALNGLSNIFNRSIASEGFPFYIFGINYQF